MRKRTLQLLLAAGVGYAGLCVVMFLGQKSFVFHPTAEVESAFAGVLWLDDGGQRLKIWQIERTGERALIYFGGNAENVAGSIQQLSATLPRHSIFLPNYRGYGGSTGRPSQNALFTDAQRLFDHVAARYSSVSVIGRSLGTGVATHLAAVADLDKLVLVTPFDGLLSIARNRFPYLPTRLLLTERFDSLSVAGDIEEPVLIVLAETDRVVPHESSYTLFSSLEAGQADIVTIPGTNHDSITIAGDYWLALMAYLTPEALR